MKTLLALVLFFSCPARAEITVKPVEYLDSTSGHPATLEGLIAYDSSWKEKRPGVMVIHEWTGIDDYTRMRLKKIAQLGYVAFAADIYGKGIRPSHPKDAAATAGIYKNDRALLRERARLALAKLKSQPQVDSNRVAAMGYCFGGTAALELARSGAQANGFISFHGGLDTPNRGDAKKIRARVAVYTGANDPMVPPSEVAAFENEMKSAGIPYEIVSYPGAVHGFTNPAHGNKPESGVAYQADADRRSWEAMKAFLERVFKLN